MHNLKISDCNILYLIRKQCFDDIWTENDFLLMLSNKLYFGFRIDEKGFILCRKILDEIEIITFGVIPIYRRQGLGRRLLQSVINYAKTTSKNNKIFLEVAEDNIPAQSLYKSFGFQKISIRKNYYNSITKIKNAVVMQLLTY